MNGLSSFMAFDHRNQPVPRKGNLRPWSPGGEVTAESGDPWR